jgi:hypothetical protein
MAIFDRNLFDELIFDVGTIGPILVEGPLNAGRWPVQTLAGSWPTTTVAGAWPDQTLDGEWPQNIIAGVWP